VLERLPGDTVILDVMDPPGRYSMFLLCKVPSFRTGWKTWPERESDQGDWEGDDTLYESQL
jgi:hypothetical protein